MRLTHQQKPIAVIPYERCAAKTTPEGKPGMSVIEHCRIAGENLDTDGKFLRPLSEALLALFADGNKEVSK